MNKITWTTAIKKLSTQISTPPLTGNKEAHINTLKTTIQEIKVMWDQIRGSMFKLKQDEAPADITHNPRATSSAFVFDEKYRKRVQILYVKEPDNAFINELSTELESGKGLSRSHLSVPANFNLFRDNAVPTPTFPYLPWVADLGNRQLNEITGSILMVDHIPIAAFHSEGYEAFFGAPYSDKDYRARTGEKATIGLEALRALSAVTIHFDLGTTPLADAKKTIEEDTQKLNPLEEKLTQSEKDLKAAKQRQQELQKENDSLKEQLEEPQSENTQHQATINSLQEKLKNNDAELAQAKANLQTAKAERDSLNTEVGQLKQSIQDLTRRLDSADAVISPPPVENVCM